MERPTKLLALLEEEPLATEHQIKRLLRYIVYLEIEETKFRKKEGKGPTKRADRSNLKERVDGAICFHKVSDRYRIPPGGTLYCRECKEFLI